MAMPDINYTQNTAGYNLETGPGPSFGAPGGGMDLDALFRKMAARKAGTDLDKRMEERYRFDLENQRAQEMQDAQLRALQPARPTFGGEEMVEVPQSPGPIMSVAPGATFNVRRNSLAGQRGFMA